MSAPDNIHLLQKEMMGIEQPPYSVYFLYGKI